MYNDLLTALKATSIPFTDCEWSTRPSGCYGVANLEMEASALSADGAKQERAYEGSVDLFLTSRDSVKVKAVEDAIASVCGASFMLNSTQYEAEQKLLHYEWVFQLESD